MTIFYFTEYLTLLSSRQSVPEEWSVMVYAVQTCLIKIKGNKLFFKTLNLILTINLTAKVMLVLSERQTTAEVVKVSLFSKNITCSHLTAIH